MNRFIVGLCSLTLLFGACGGEESGGDTALAEIDCSREPPLEWENYASGFFDKNCNGCHSSQLAGDARYDAPVGIDFDTEAVTIAYAGRIRARVLDDQTMPPGAGLTPTEQRMVDEWLLCVAGE